LRRFIPNLGLISIHMETSLGRTEATFREARDEKVTKAVEEAKKVIQGIEEIHEVAMIESKGMKLLTLHVELKPDIPLREAHHIASNIEMYLKEKLGIDEVDIHLEPRKTLKSEISE
ncbi:MAG: hypothetical protein NZ955_06255, partial [Candidatus Bathyarchaeota archaeon]|nr:hypothetical protein [Candidatus Bathyarchaeota archaeon]